MVIFGLIVGNLLCLLWYCVCWYSVGWYCLLDVSLMCWNWCWSWCGYILFVFFLNCCKFCLRRNSCWVGWYFGLFGCLWLCYCGFWLVCSWSCWVDCGCCVVVWWVYCDWWWLYLIGIVWLVLMCYFGRNWWRWWFLCCWVMCWEILVFCLFRLLIVIFNCCNCWFVWFVIVLIIVCWFLCCVGSCFWLCYIGCCCEMCIYVCCWLCDCYMCCWRRCCLVL